MASCSPVAHTPPLQTRHMSLLIDTLDYLEKDSSLVVIIPKIILIVFRGFLSLIHDSMIRSIEVSPLKNKLQKLIVLYFSSGLLHAFTWETIPTWVLEDADPDP
jgi:hypothetical protein